MQHQQTAKVLLLLSAGAAWRFEQDLQQGCMTTGVRPKGISSFTKNSLSNSNLNKGVELKGCNANSV